MREQRYLFALAQQDPSAREDAALCAAFATIEQSVSEEGEVAGQWIRLSDSGP